MADLTNGPFNVCLSSIDGGKTISWKIMDKDGRIHKAGRDPMPDFAGGSGMVLSLSLEVMPSDDVGPQLEKFPVDGAVVERRLGTKFMEGLRDD